MSESLRGLQVVDCLLVRDVRGRVLGEQDQHRDEREDDEVAGVQPLTGAGAQVDGVQAHLHGVGRHQGG